MGRHGRWLRHHRVRRRALSASARQSGAAPHAGLALPSGGARHRSLFRMRRSRRASELTILRGKSPPVLFVARVRARASISVPTLRSALHRGRHFGMRRRSATPRGSHSAVGELRVNAFPVELRHSRARGRSLLWRSRLPGGWRVAHRGDHHSEERAPWGSRPDPRRSSKHPARRDPGDWCAHGGWARVSCRVRGERRRRCGDIRGAAAELGLPKTNLWVYGGYDHDGNFARFREDPASSFPVVFISFPSSKDPDFERRHPGLATVDIITLVPYEWFRPWENGRWQKRGAEYEAFKARLAERLLQTAFREVPSIQGKIHHAELSTPLSTRHFAGHAHGEIYGLAHSPARFDARWLRAKTPVNGLFLCGADICCCGVAGALAGGVLSACAVLGKNLLPAILSRRHVAPDRRKADRPASQGGVVPPQPSLPAASADRLFRLFRA